MFKSSAGKIFLGFLIFASACSFWRANENAASSPTPFAAPEIKSEIPFSTKEPEIYQTEIVTQTYANGEKTESKIFTARNRAMRLTIFNPGAKSELARLELYADSAFLIYRGRKIYAETDSNNSAETSNDLLTVGRLDQKTAATFENLGTENNLTKFRVSLEEAEVANSEILIYVDENIKLPVKQEFYSANGEQKTVTFSVEMQNFKFEAGEQLFELPKDYKKVSPEEFQKILRQERIKNE